MKLKIKVKCTIVAEAKTKSNPSFDIQKNGPYWIEFPLSEVRGFTDSDIQYIIAELPEYKYLQMGIKHYIERLEGNKAEVLEQIKAKSRKFMDVDVLALKIKLNTKIKHYIDFAESFPDDYDLDYYNDIPDYDPTDNNLK